jgi:hypothetical protein
LKIKDLITSGALAGIEPDKQLIRLLNDKSGMAREILANPRHHQQ